MKTDTANKLIKYIKTNKRATAKELQDHLDISRQALFKHLNHLLTNDKIYKIGRPPKVFYFIKEQNTLKSDINWDIDADTKEIIEKNFLIITPSGERKEGIDGFIYWCKKTNQPIEKTAEEYIKTIKKYNNFKKNGFIDGLSKLKNTFPKVYLNNLFYLDFYSIERFGKTKMGQLLLYAKQSQNKVLIKELTAQIQDRIKYLIKKHKITSVGFIPPTVKRETQLMKELENRLHLNLQKIPILKIKTEIAVPQKTLSKLADRVENAKNTILIEDRKIHKNILLIDDAIGSGATINETAAQIKKAKICKGKIIGLAITGSFKGFDVISEI